MDTYLSYRQLSHTSFLFGVLTGDPSKGATKEKKINRNESNNLQSTQPNLLGVWILAEAHSDLRLVNSDSAVKHSSLGTVCEVL
jgi:hypothetical protein